MGIGSCGWMIDISCGCDDRYGCGLGVVRLGAKARGASEPKSGRDLVDFSLLCGCVYMQIMLIVFV